MHIYYIYRYTRPSVLLYCSYRVYMKHIEFRFRNYWYSQAFLSDASVDLVISSGRLPAIFLSPRQITLVTLRNNRRGRRTIGFGGICGRHTRELQVL